MFSLIITVIAIALVAGLALATLYYGGDVFQKSAAQAEANKLMNQGQQIMGAADLYYTEHRAWPPSLQALVDGKYLKDVPVAQAEGVGTAHAVQQKWTMPQGGIPVFLLTGDVQSPACAKFNKMGSVKSEAIPAKAFNGFAIQCFGSTQSTADLKVVFRKAVTADTHLNHFLPVVEIAGTELPTAPKGAEWTVEVGTAPVTPPSSGGGTGNNGGGTGGGGNTGGGNTGGSTGGGTGGGTTDPGNGTGGGTTDPGNGTGGGTGGGTPPVGGGTGGSGDPGGSTGGSGTGGSTGGGTGGSGGTPPAAADALTVSPANIDFGQLARNAYADRAVTITNVSTSSVVFASAPSLTSSVGFFSKTTTCGTTLAAGANCMVTVRYQPTAYGDIGNNTLSVYGASTAEQHTVGLTGSSAPAPGSISVSPASITFASIEAGTSAQQTVTVTNVGGQSLTFSGSPALTSNDLGYYGSSTTCSGTLASGASCTVTVTFSPTLAAASVPGTLTVYGATGDTPKTVSISGAATGAPVLVPSDPTLACGQVALGSSCTLVLKVSNLGTDNLVFSSVPQFASGSSPNFSYTQDCGTSLAPGAFCKVNVKYTPTAYNESASGTLHVYGNLTTSDFVTVNVTGSSGAPSLVAGTATPIDFAKVQPGSINERDVTVQNTGTDVLTFAAAPAVQSASAPVTVSASTCGTSLAAGASCMVTVRYAPTVFGDSTSTVVRIFGWNASTNYIDVPVTGSTPTGAALAVSPQSVDFGSVAAGSSTTQVVTLSNSGEQTLTFGGAASLVADTNGYVTVASNSCGASLAGGASCNVTLRFSPIYAVANASATLQVYGSGSSPVAIPVTGSATGTALLTRSPSSIAFGQVAVNSSNTSTVTVSNQGTDVLTFSSAAQLVNGSAGAFSISATSCSTTLAPGTSCTVTVRYNETAWGQTDAGTLRIFGAGSTSLDVTLSGSTPQSPANVQADVSSLDFGTLSAGTNSTKTVTLTNSGQQSFSFTSGPSLSGNANSYYSMTTTCGATLSGGASCIVNVKFAPTYAVSNDTATLAAAGATGSVSVGASGSATGAPQPTATAGTTSWSGVSVNSTNTSQVTVSNLGTDVMTFTTGLTGAAPSFSLQTPASNACNGTLQPGTSCYVNVQYKPTSNGDVSSATFVLTANGGSPNTVSISYSGTSLTAASLGATPTSYAFTGATAGQTYQTTVTLKNSGQTSATLVAGSAIVTTSGYYSVLSDGCTSGTVLAYNGTCSVTVKFAPTFAGNTTATLRLNGAVDVALSGSATGTPVLAAAPTSYGFGQGLSGSTYTKQFTVSNTGTAPAVLSAAPSMASGSSAMFSIVASTAPQCASGTSLAAGDTCNVTVQYAPTAVSDSSSGTLAVAAAGATTLNVAVTGSTGTPQLQVQPTGGTAAFQGSTTSWTFATQSANGVTTNTITLANTGSDKLTFAATPAFQSGSSSNIAQTATTCGTSLAVGANCTVTVRYTAPATVPDASTAVLRVYGQTTANYVDVTLNGNTTPAYATFDTTASKKGTNIALTNGNLTASTSAFTGAYSGVAIGNKPKSSGKYYFEVTMNSTGMAIGLANGAGPGQVNTRASANNSANDAEEYLSTGSVASGNTTMYSTSSITLGDTVGVAVDLTNPNAVGMTWYRKTGTGACTTILSLSNVKLTNSLMNTITTFTPSIGINSTGSNQSSVTANFGGSAFKCTVPTGYTAGWY